MTTIELAGSSLVVLIGAAGAGKSTFARRHFPLDEILSSDALRATVAGDEADQSATGAAFAVLHRELGRRMAAGQTTVIDATNLRASDRRALLRRARAAGRPAAAIVLGLPPDVVHARNGARTRVVDPGVVDRHLTAAGLVADPERLAAEGFDPVVILRTPSEVDAVRIVRGAVSPPV